MSWIKKQNMFWLNINFCPKLRTYRLKYNMYNRVQSIVWAGLNWKTESESEFDVLD